MRHFVGLFDAIATLACGMGVASAQAGLVTLTGGLHATGANQSGTRSAAVTVTPVAVAADDHGGAATRTQIASGVWLHRHMRPTGLGWTRPDVS